MVSQFFDIREFPLIQPEAELALFGVAILLIDTFLENGRSGSTPSPLSSAWDSAR
jgi:hypothetical protein